MLDVLKRVEQELFPEALKSLDGWNRLLVDYEEPHVHRLWRPFKDYRVYLHRILHCDKAFFHPHPWPCAIRIVQGRYEMALGYGAPTLDPPPPLCAVVELAARSTYEMTDPNLWHSVRPTGFDQSISVMVTGKPWQPRTVPKPINKTPLPDEAANMLLLTCLDYYTNGWFF